MLLQWPTQSVNSIALHCMLWPLCIICSCCHSHARRGHFLADLICHRLPSHKWNNFNYNLVTLSLSLRYGIFVRHSALYSNWYSLKCVECFLYCCTRKMWKVTNSLRLSLTHSFSLFPCIIFFSCWSNTDALCFNNCIASTALLLCHKLLYLLLQKPFSEISVFERIKYGIQTL